MKPLPIQRMLTYILLFRPCTALVLSGLFSEGSPQDNLPIPSSTTRDNINLSEQKTSAWWSHTGTVFVASDSIFLVDCSRWLLLLRPCWKDLFQSVFLDYNPSHFASQVCSRIFGVSSLPDCGRLSFFLNRTVDIMICFSQHWLFWIARTVWRLGSYWDPSYLKLFAIISWTRRWRLPPHTRPYFLGSCYVPSSCFFWKYECGWIVHRFVFCVSNICSDSLRTSTVWNRKNSLFKEVIHMVVIFFAT